MPNEVAESTTEKEFPSRKQVWFEAFRLSMQCNGGATYPHHHNAVLAAGETLDAFDKAFEATE